MGCSPTTLKNSSNNNDFKIIPCKRRISIQDLPNDSINHNLIISNNNKGIYQEEEDPFKYYINLEFIKQSIYTCLLKVKHKDSNDIRIMKIYYNKSKNKYNKITINDIKNQIDLLKSLSHPNIISLIEVFYYNENFYLIYEYCNSGDLYEYINNNLNINENLCKIIIHQLLKGLNYLHNKGIILCNLAPDHVVIYKQDDNLYIKIIDFGAFSLIGNDNNVIITGYKDISNKNVIPPDAIYSIKIDIWSVGIIMYFLVSGIMPFNGKSIKEVKQNIMYIK